MSGLEADARERIAADRWPHLSATQRAEIASATEGLGGDLGEAQTVADAFERMAADYGSRAAA